MEHSGIEENGTVCTNLIKAGKGRKAQKGCEATPKQGVPCHVL